MIGTKNLWAIDQTMEASFGTAATTPDKSHPVRMERPLIVMGYADNADALIGVYEEGSQRIPVSQMMTATIEADATIDLLLLYLRYCLGGTALSTGYTVSGTNPYTHTLTQPQGDTPSFTGYWRDPLNTATTYAWRYVGCKVKSVTIKSSRGGKITATIEIMGSGTYTDQTTITMPALSTDPILAHALISAFTIGGTSFLASLAEFEVKFENKYSEQSEFAAGSLVLPMLERTGFAISGSMTLKTSATAADTTGLIADIIAQTSRAVVLTITSGSQSLAVTIDQAKFDNTAVTGQNGKLEKPLPFIGQYSTSGSRSCQIVGINATASYLT